MFTIRTAPLASLIFLVEWVLMNGVWYVLAGLNLGLISIVAQSYLVFIWSPLSFEKALQIPLAFYLARKITNYVKRLDLRKDNNYKNTKWFWL